MKPYRIFIKYKTGQAVLRKIRCENMLHANQVAREDLIGRKDLIKKLSITEI